MMCCLRKKNTHGGQVQKRVTKKILNNNKHRVRDSEKRKIIARDKKKKKLDEELQLQNMEIFLVKKTGGNNNNKKEGLPSLPEELIVENILTRSSGTTLALCSCVSKSWNNSIYNDTRFATSHYIQNQNKLSLFFSLLKPVGATENDKMAYILGLETEKHDSDVLRLRTYEEVMGTATTELVGYCNGLACVKLGIEGTAVCALVVINPTRGQRLCLYCRYDPSEFIPLCHGFGFDPVSQEYKVVVVIKKTTAPEITCMVCTLGTYSWRYITTAFAEISPLSGAYALPSGTVIKISRNFCTSATFCGVDLIWRITVNREEDIYNDDDKIELLLSFDLHNEKLQLHPLPAESTLTPTNENEYLVVDHHLLEFKGYPCIARVEKIMISNSNHRCLSVFCSSCSRCKIHMYILKDKEKWIEEETFDVQIKDQKGLLPDTFRCCVDTSTTSTAITLPTRLLTFSDQVILYWFDGDCLVFYNLQTKHLKVVKGTPTTHGIQDDDNMYCTYMDYQLHAQVENFQSLKTFIPEKNSYKFRHLHNYYQFITHKLQAGSLVTGREYVTYYSFF